MNPTATMEQGATEFGQASFLRKTYTHLFGAVLAFIGLEYVLFTSGIALTIAPILNNNWILLIGGFTLIGFLTNYFSCQNSSIPLQYAQMALMIVMQAIIFVPILVIAVYYTDISLLINAAMISVAMFAALTAYVSYTGINFSFLGPFLLVIGLAAFIAIIGAILLEVTLGFYFAIAMVVFAAATVLYQTSNVLHEYGPGQHVMAATGLFSSVAILFYYVLATILQRR